MSGSIRGWAVAATACLVASITGCADLPPIEPFACGNGVLEEGEACEFAEDPFVCGAPATAQECRYLCAGGAPCPPGSGCGADFECRHGFDEFKQAEGSPYRIEAADFHIGDIDGDDFPDIIGFNPAGFTARFGDASGGFAGELDLAVSTTGLPGFGYFDGDERLDVVAPTIGGILGFQGADDRTFDSLPFAAFDASLAQVGGRILPINSGNDVFDNLLLFIDNKICHPNVCTLPPGVSAEEEELPGGHTANQIVGQIVKVDLDHPMLLVPPREEFALAFVGGSQVYVYELLDVGTPPDLLSPIKASLRQAVTVPGVVQRSVFFADVDSNGEQDMIVPVRVGPADRTVIAYGDGTGRFFGAEVATWFHTGAIPPLVNFQDGCSSNPWPLAVGNFNDDGLPDYVGDRGICFGLSGLGFLNVVPLVTPQLVWNEAVIADFNGDGRNDVATAFEGIDGIDFYLGTGFLFNRDHVDTDDPPFQLRVGDFNGDFFLDLAVDENGEFEESGDHSLSVLFGRPDGAPDRPQSMARFPVIEDMQPLDLVSVSAIDQITDIMVLSTDGRNPPARSVSVLFGDAEDQMLAPFFGEDSQVPFMAQIGQFSPEGDGIADIVGITMKVDFSQPIPVDLNDRRLVYLPGAEKGQFPVQDSRIAIYPSTIEFAESCSLLATVDLDADGVDSIVAVDGSNMLQAVSPFCALEPDRQDQPRLMVATMRTGDGGTLDPTFDTDELPGVWIDTRHLDFHDLDGDGLPEMIVTYGGNEAGNGAGVVAYWNHGGDLSFTDASSITTFPGDPLGATALNTDGEPKLELAVLTTEGISLYRWDDATKQFNADPVRVVELNQADTSNVRGPARIIAADIDRDGVEDLVATFGPRVHVFLAQTLDRVFVEEGM